MSRTEFINEDLTTLDHVEAFLKKALSLNREIPAGSILQIQQIVNASVPKQDGHQHYDPERHVLKVTLTDGSSSVSALVAEPLTKINSNTPPGTKIKCTQAIPIIGQLAILTRNNHQFLGGEVGHLIEKWKFQRKMEVKQDWGTMGCLEGSEGPPLWRPFGQKNSELDLAALRKMKAMDIVNEQKDGGKEDGSQTNFDVQRSEAISELMDKSVKQKWQKPNKRLLDKEVIDIMDEGFTMEEASDALSKFKNVQRALKFLKGKKGEFSTEEKATTFEERKERKKRNPKNQDDEDDAPIPKEYQRPNKSISLFGFIAEHIKSDDNSATAADASASQSSDRKFNGESDYSYDRGRGGGRGGRGNQRGYTQRYSGDKDTRQSSGRGGYNRSESGSDQRFNSNVADRNQSTRGRAFNESKSGAEIRGFSSSGPSSHSGTENRGYNNSGPPKHSGTENRGYNNSGPPSHSGTENRGYKNSGPPSHSGTENRGYSNSGQPSHSGTENRGYNNSGPSSHSGAANRGYNNSGPTSRGYNDSGPTSRKYNESGASTVGYNDSTAPTSKYNDPTPAARVYNDRGDYGTSSRGYKGSGGSRGFNDSGPPTRSYNDSAPAGRGYNDFKSSSRGYNDTAQPGQGHQDSRASQRGFHNSGPPNTGYNDYDSSNRRFQERENPRGATQQRGTYSPRNSGPAGDPQNYYQPPRFQKQQSPQYPGTTSVEASPVPSNSFDSRNHQEPNYLSPSQSFPPGNYQPRGSGSEGYSHRQQSQQGGYRPDATPQQDDRQYGYGASDSWSLNQTMVFTRSKPDGSGGRGSGPGRGGYSSRGGGYQSSPRY